MLEKILLFVLLSITANAEPFIHTKLGSVRGIVDNSVDIPVEAYLGIPFAKPPTGGRRFSEPEPFGDFGTLDATSYRPACVQSTIDLGTNTSEDCLYLNVFRKQKTDEENAHSVGKLPVVIIIHGGAFAFGSPQHFSYNGVPLAALGDIVVVTIQYRLGILGFAQTDRIPANLGLEDQKLAIKWVHDNIASYGGDPRKVTLMGVSAGSMSVSAHIMQPTSGENYYQSVIMDAGVMDGIAVSVRETMQRMQKIAASLRCPLSGDESLQCLREAPLDDLIRLSYKVPTSKTTFVPTGEQGDFWSPRRRGPKGFVKVRMMIGTAKDEGQIFVPKGSGAGVTNGDEFVAVCDELQKFAGLKANMDHPETIQLLKKEYFEKFDDVRTAASEFVGDTLFKCPVNDFVESYSNVSDEIFVYRFDRKLAQHYKLTFIDPDDGATHWTPYVHFSGNLLALGPFVHPSDREFSIDSVNMIVSFIRGESPSFRGRAWPEFTKTGEMFVIDEIPSTQPGLDHLKKCEILHNNYLSRELDTERDEL